MYGQTGSGKTFTMMGPHSTTYSSMATSQDMRGQDTLRIRFDSMGSSLATRTSKTMISFDGNNTLDSSRTLFKSSSLTQRSKSPMMIREKTPIRLDKSPVKLFKDNLPTPSKGYDNERNKSEGELEGKMIIEDHKNSVHKRASTVNFSTSNDSSGEAINFNPMQTPTIKVFEGYNEISAIHEQEIIKNMPENSEGILVLALKDIFTEIEKVFDFL